MFIVLTTADRKYELRINIAVIATYRPMRKNSIFSRAAVKPTEDDFENSLVKLTTGEEIEVTESALIIDDMIDAAVRLHPSVTDNKSTCRGVTHFA